MCHKVSVVAFDAAGDPDRYPEPGEPWQPLKLYYHMGFTKARIIALHEAMLAAGLESPYAEWLDELGGARRTRATGSPPGCACGEYFEVRDDALRAHATQVDPDGLLVPRAAGRCSSRSGRPRTSSWSGRWSTARLPEDDLFAGVRETASPSRLSG